VEVGVAAGGSQRCVERQQRDGLLGAVLGARACQRASQVASRVVAALGKVASADTVCRGPLGTVNLDTAW